jgi:hypothetical protein
MYTGFNPIDGVKRAILLGVFWRNLIFRALEPV